MKQLVQHPVYGDIIYSESFWSGKKTLTVNGVAAQSISKKEFAIEEKRIIIEGSFLAGIKLRIDDETIEVSPKPKWYEIALATLPLVFLLSWGNSEVLCSIFPVVGGAIGGALGAIGSTASLLLMKKSSSPIAKLLIGTGALAATFFAGFLLALALILLIA